MPRRYRTVDVFTRTRFGGNPLAVVLDADGLDDVQMQAIAMEFNYSETSFVCRPADPRHTAHVRIFTPTDELPFAGHPNVGTAYVLASLADAPADAFIFEEKAGLVRIGLQRADGAVQAAYLTAPQTPTRGATLDREAVAACLGLGAADIAVARHAPVVASVGLPFVVAEIASRAALRRAKADPAAFANVPCRPMAPMRSISTRATSAPGTGRSISRRACSACPKTRRPAARRARRRR